MRFGPTIPSGWVEAPGFVRNELELLWQEDEMPEELKNAPGYTPFTLSADAQAWVDSMAEIRELLEGGEARVIGRPRPVATREHRIVAAPPPPPPPAPSPPQYRAPAERPAPPPPPKPKPVPARPLPEIAPVAGVFDSPGPQPAHREPAAMPEIGGREPVPPQQSSSRRQGRASEGRMPDIGTSPARPKRRRYDPAADEEGDPILRLRGK
ncbi:MAG: hypothetical protein JOZ41_15660 [Chloroflexi bacterium]|nr:hypothetical protein [Chloroflexota bacterium]